MKYATYTTALALAFSVVAAAQAQTAGTGPIARVLTHRAELSLNADQVKKLEAIEAKYAQKDRELVAQVEKLRGKPVGVPLRMRGMPAAEREKLRANQAQLRPLMQQLRTSHTAAISEMQVVLTAQQNTQAAAYLHAGPGNGPGRGAGRGRGPGRGAHQSEPRGMGWRAGW